MENERSEKRVRVRRLAFREVVLDGSDDGSSVVLELLDIDFHV